MAVIKTITTDRGVVYPDQYCRVDKVDAWKDKMLFDVGVYLNQVATENPPHRVIHFNGDFDMYSDLNLWQQAYAILKQQWPDSVDA